MQRFDKDGDHDKKIRMTIPNNDTHEQAPRCPIHPGPTQISLDLENKSAELRDAESLLSPSVRALPICTSRIHAYNP